MKSCVVKKLLIVMFFIGVFFVFGMGSVSALEINFTNPTPADGISNHSFIVNTTNDAILNSYSFLDINSTSLFWLNFDSISGGTTFVDYFQRYNGTIGGGTNITEGNFKNASIFDGNADTINLGDVDELDGASEFTISYWVKPSQWIDTNVGIMYKSNTFYMRLTDTAPIDSYKIFLRPYGLSGTSYSTSGWWNCNQWHHIVLTKSTSQMYIYVDGVLDSGFPQTATGSLDSTSSSLILGDATSTADFNGSMDDILVLSRYLSQDEINSIYNSTVNKYTHDFTSYASPGDSVNYTAYILDSSGSSNSTEQRTFTYDKAIDSILSPVYPNRQILNPVNLTISTNFNASCEWSNDSGIINYSMDTIDNRIHNYTIVLPEINNMINFYCNDSTDNVTNQISFNVSDHLTYYVDNSSATCSDSYDKNYATSEDTPFCNINSGALSSGVSAGDEIVIKYMGGAGYCEGISVSALGIDGTFSDPIIIRGENDSSRTYLNGTCAEGTNAFSFTGEDYWTIKYFEIYNFSNDGGNVHASGSDNSLGIKFENLTINTMGWVDSGAPGDGISFHENCTGKSSWINMTNGLKGGVIDVSGANTNYSNMFINNFENYGIGFSGSNVNGEIHYIWAADVRNSGNCLDTTDDVVITNLTCVNNTQDLNGEIYVIGGTTNITRFNVSLSGNQPSINVVSAIGNFMNGYIDSNISLSSSGNATLTNVTYGGSTEEIVLSGSTLTRKFYLDASSSVANTNITIINSSGEIIYSNLTTAIPQQTLLSYINNGGTTTYYSNYTITASADGYVTNTTEINLTDNFDLNFVLVATPSSDSPSSSGGTPTYNPTESNIQQGYSKQLGKSWKLKFTSNEEEHQLKLDSFNPTNKTATITISSKPQTKTLSVGEEWKVNLDGDDNYDLLVRLENVTTIRANVFIMEIDEEIVLESEVVVEEDEKVDEEIVEDKPETNWLLFIGYIILVIVLLGGAFIIGKKYLKKK